MADSTFTLQTIKAVSDNLKEMSAGISDDFYAHDVSISPAFITLTTVDLKSSDAATATSVAIRTLFTSDGRFISRECHGCDEESDEYREMVIEQRRVFNYDTYEG